MKHWTVIHKNCREHYATPRILHRLGLLDRMITEVWWPPAQRARFPFAKALCTRWHSDLEAAVVVSLNRRWLPHKVLAKFRRRPVWEMLEAEDELFQRLVANRLSPHLKRGPEGICFAYSYTALEPFRAAKAAGWKTVLGQIDPGPAEWDVVDAASAPWRGWEEQGARPSASYWRKWRQETELADLIIANSVWSATLLERQGIPASKLRVVPLLYEPAVEGPGPKGVPEQFTSARPLRVLFLGSLCLRKGVPALLEAIRILGEAPIQLRLVGPQAMRLPDWVEPLLAAGKVLIEPPAKGPEVVAAYDWADVFSLPTHSDGFAITQLEAQARRLPVIASRHCAAVVRDGENGRLLAEVSPEAIAECLREILAEPAALRAWSAASEVPLDCRMERLMETYLELTRELE
jgi:glycosyltransferase involved in cell wall biosynthesis